MPDKHLSVSSGLVFTVLLLAFLSGTAASDKKDTIQNSKHSTVLATTGDRRAGIALPVRMDSFSFLDDFPAKGSADSLGLVNGQQKTLAKHASPGASKFVKHKLLKLFILVLSLFVISATVFFFRSRRRNNQNFMKQTRLSIMDKEVRRACKYIESNYANPELNPEFICRELVTGQAFLEALFQRELGMSIPAFISQVRIHHARSILEADAGMNPQEIASQTGFTDEKSLHETFLRVTGKKIGDK
jgi:AraC-like DNA-binding protein